MSRRFKKNYPFDILQSLSNSYLSLFQILFVGLITLRKDLLAVVKPQSSYLALLNFLKEDENLVIDPEVSHSYIFVTKNLIT